MNASDKNQSPCRIRYTGYDYKIRRKLTESVPSCRKYTLQHRCANTRRRHIGDIIFFRRDSTREKIFYAVIPRRTSIIICLIMNGK